MFLSTGKVLQQKSLYKMNLYEIDEEESAEWKKGDE